jgi:predicted O-linked N-acetylglucosamine transferase (SPINDLY family)
MDHFAYLMACMKLAKIQCNTWGHSDTSGIDTIDYYFSSKLYELPYEEAQTHYSEKLILQNSLCTSYINPLSRHNPSLFKSKEHFGITSDTIAIFCGQSLFKLNPIYDDYLIQILKGIDNCILVLLENDNKAKIIKRFNNTGIGYKLRFFPGMQHFDYMNLMNICDFVLDVYPFGGCNSSFESFSLGKVIVTQPSIMINGRFTTGFYKKMELDELICNSKEEYIKFAIKLGNDNDYRKDLENKIKENSNKLFLDQETVDEWKNDLIRIYNDYNINNN